MKGRYFWGSREETTGACHRNKKRRKAVKFKDFVLKKSLQCKCEIGRHCMGMNYDKEKLKKVLKPYDKDAVNKVMKKMRQQRARGSEKVSNTFIYELPIMQEL